MTLAYLLEAVGTHISPGAAAYHTVESVSVITRPVDAYVQQPMDLAD